MTPPQRLIQRPLLELVATFLTDLANANRVTTLLNSTGNRLTMWGNSTLCPRQFCRPKPEYPGCQAAARRQSVCNERRVSNSSAKAIRWLSPALIV